MIINRDQHLNQRVQPRDNRYFAAQQPWVSLVIGDITAITHAGLPIVIPAGPHALPQALITPCGDDHPFGQHTPRLWQHYPFTLTQHVVGLDAKDSGQLGSVLQGDPSAPHWWDQTGCRLFDEDGQASNFLNDTLTGLRAVQKEVMETQQLVWRLHQHRVLTPCAVHHAGYALDVYRIDIKQLTERLGSSTDDQDMRLLMMATNLEDSQASLEHWLRTGTSCMASV